MLFTIFLFLHSKIITTFATEKQKDGITGNGFRYNGYRNPLSYCTARNIINIKKGLKKLWLTCHKMATTRW